MLSIVQASKTSSVNPDSELTAWLEVVKAYQACYAALTRELKPLALSVAQHDMLAAIRADDGLNQQRLAEKLLVVKSNVTALLARLEERRLIYRETDAQDARAKRVYLTDEGSALVARSLKCQQRVIQRMVEVLEPAEVMALETVMRRVRTALQAKAPE